MFAEELERLRTLLKMSFEPMRFMPLNDFNGSVYGAFQSLLTWLSRPLVKQLQFQLSCGNLIVYGLFF